MFPFHKDRLALRSRPILALQWVVLVAAVGAGETEAAEPGRSPSRFVPAQGLTAYVEYDGLDAHAAAWRATAGFAILQGTPAGAIIAATGRQLLANHNRVVTGNRVNAAEFIPLGERIIRQGFAVAYYEEAGGTSIVFVLNGLGIKESRARFERFVQFELSPDEPAIAFPVLPQVPASDLAQAKELPRPKRFRGRDLYRIEDHDNAGDEHTARWVWWFEGNDLIVVSGSIDELGDVSQKAEKAGSGRNPVVAVLDTIEGKQPNVSTHPGHVAALAEGGDLTGFEPDGMFFVESRNPLGKGVLSDLRDRFEFLPGTKEKASEFDVFDALDISRARRIVGRWGFRSKSLVTDIRFEAPAPWSGLLGLLKPAGFRKDRLPPIPRGMGAFAVGSFVHGDIRGATASLVPLLKAKDRQGFTALEEMIRNGTSQRARQDLLRHIGPTGCVFAAPGGSKDTVDSTVASYLIAVDDAPAVGKALDELASQINNYYRGLKDGGGAGDANEADGSQPAIALERLPAPDRGYRLTSPTGLISWITEDQQPTILLGESFIAISNNPVLARAAIAAESRPADRWVPTGELMKLFESLPTNVAFLFVGNPRDSFWPETIANLPKTFAPYLGKVKSAQTFKVPRAQALRALLFPSILAAVIDDRGLRVISLEALPIGCFGIGSTQNFFLPGPMMLDLQFAPRR